MEDVDEFELEETDDDGDARAKRESGDDIEERELVRATSCPLRDKLLPLSIFDTDEE